MAWCLLIYLFL